MQNNTSYTTWQANAHSSCFTRLCCDRLSTHEHTSSTKCLHPGLVLSAWQQPPHSVAVRESSTLQHTFMKHSEHGDGRGVPHLPAQGVVGGAKQCLTQVLNVGMD